jgi:hypothetical protein
MDDAMEGSMSGGDRVSDIVIDGHKLAERPVRRWRVGDVNALIVGKFDHRLEAGDVRERRLPERKITGDDDEIHGVQRRREEAATLSVGGLFRIGELLEPRNASELGDGLRPLASGPPLLDVLDRAQARMTVPASHR